MSSPLNQILFELREIKSFIAALPEWTPITKRLANERGYKTTLGLQKHCENTLHPDDFKKIDGKWHIRTAAIQNIKPKIYLSDAEAYSKKGGMYAGIDTQREDLPR